MVKKLLIIGNGFDLHIDLKSRFRDFFENGEIKIIEEWIKSNKIKIKDVNFFSLLLYNSFYRKKERIQVDILEYVDVDYIQKYNEAFKLDKYPVNWMDVESFIKAVLDSYFMVVLSQYFNGPDDLISNYNICVGDNLGDFLSHIYNKYDKKLSMYDFLYLELRQFEEKFSNYMKEQVTDEYEKNANQFLDKLVDLSFSGTIINFNYTKINSSRFNEINVHGDLNSSIIIGIDSTDCKKTSIPFTKTFRKMEMKNNVSILEDSFNEIIIYGHSLGEQDYSYFQSIFDYLNIYSNKIKIRFIYSDNFLDTDKEKNEYKYDKIKDVFLLLDKYGETLDNKAHGKNLKHKLLLEGRLEIELVN